MRDEFGIEPDSFLFFKRYPFCAETANAFPDFSSKSLTERNYSPKNISVFFNRIFSLFLKKTGKTDSMHVRKNGNSGGLLSSNSYPHRLQNHMVDKPDIKSLFRDLAACIPHLFAEIGIPIKEQHFLR